RMPTARNQAAIYRLTGDRNPLHIDPESARKAGLDAPILHGASMAGIATRAVLRRPPLGGECFVSQIDIRFTGMAYPGRSVDVECWLGADRTAFRCLEADTHRELAFGHVVWELESATGTGLETEYAEQAD
ncbi:MAG TPA: hypothetical protein DD502_31550, partial [Cupriavidus sp.]|nr:hypothetical protein [Cupriavidus sp.]